MVLRRRTESLLANNTRRNNVPNSSHTNGSSPATADLLLIRRGNVTSWRAFVRLAIVALCLLSIGCIAWAVDNGLKKADHHVWDWQDVPWVLIPVWTSFASFFRARFAKGLTIIGFPLCPLQLPDLLEHGSQTTFTSLHHPPP